MVAVQSNVHHRQQQEFSCPSRLTSDAQSDAPVSLDYPTRLVSSLKLSDQIFNDSVQCRFQLLSWEIPLFMSYLCWPVIIGYLELCKTWCPELFLNIDNLAWFVCCDVASVHGMFSRCSINLNLTRLQLQWISGWSVALCFSIMCIFSLPAGT